MTTTVDSRPRALNAIPRSPRYAGGTLGPMVLVLVLTTTALFPRPLAALPAGAQPSTEQQALAKTPSLSIKGITVTPSRPKANALCTLSVQLENTADRPIFSLVFEVTVDGHSLPVYDKQVYMVPIPPSVQTAKGSSSEGAANNGDAGKNADLDQAILPTDLRLFNFWTSDSQRPAPANGNLEVTVRLLEAQWLKISEETDEKGQPIEVWTPSGAVDGLPSEASVGLKLSP